MPRQDRLSLQSIAFNPTPFQAVTFTPQTADVSLLSNAFNKIEERETNLAQQRSAVRQTLGNIKEQLYASPDNNAFIDKKIKNIENSINEYALTGDYAGAINKAIDEGSRLATDAELNARLSASKEYTSEVERQRKRVESGDIDQQTFDWWYDTQATWNPTFDTDDVGNVIGLKDANIAKKAPLKSFDVAELAKAAFSLINPSETSSSSERKWSSQSGDTSGVRTGGGGSRMSGSSRRQVTEQDIKDNMAEILRTSGITFDQLVQYYQSYYHHIGVLENELAQIQKEKGIDSRDYKDKLYEKQKYENNVTNNQSDASLELFIARMINDSNYPKTLSYSITSTQSRSESDNFNIAKSEDTPNPTNPGRGDLQDNNNLAKPGNVGHWNGYLYVAGGNEGEKADRSAQSSGNNALNMLSQPKKK